MHNQIQEKEKGKELSYHITVLHVIMEPINNLQNENSFYELCPVIDQLDPSRPDTKPNYKKNLNQINHQ